MVLSGAREITMSKWPPVVCAQITELDERNENLFVSPLRALVCGPAFLRLTTDDASR